MARPALQDHLRVFPFHLVDVAPIEALALPIFTPLFGFSAISSPEMTVTTQDIVEGNWNYTTKVLQQASVSTITLSRGATFADADFWRWMKTALTGHPENFSSRGYGTAIGLAGGSPPAAALGALGGLVGFPRIGGPSPRRDLLLIHFFSHAPAPGVAQQAFQAAGTLTSFATTGPLAGAAQGLAADNFARLPARAWMLKGCIPTRYKAGGDFDALSSDVSIMELDIEVDHFDEISLAS